MAALLIGNDLSLRMSAEEALGRALSARGRQTVAAYRTATNFNQLPAFNASGSARR